MSNLTLTAPLRGWCASLDEAPDAVFADRLLGDGVAIDPTGDTLYAPCDGSVTSVAASSHAVVIRAANGAEILLHVGIDTVALDGAGFEVLTAEGATVRPGDPLLRFDLDALARSAKSLLTPVVVTNGERFRVLATRCGRTVEVGERLLEIEPVAADARSDTAANGSRASEHLRVTFQHGIHARPAALIARFAKSVDADITVSAHGRSASARSPTALMALGARHGDELRLSASGAGAATMLRELKRSILELPDSLPPADAGRAPPAATLEPAACGSRLRGVIASRGFAVGRAARLRQDDLVIDEAGRGTAVEHAALERARAEVAARLHELTQNAEPTARQVFTAHLELLDDQALLDSASRTIAEGGSAGYAWRRALSDCAEDLRALGDAHLSERIDDLRDLEAQVLLALRGEAPAMSLQLPEQPILIAPDLTPSQLVGLDPARLAGICTAAGGATSHVALLAAAMGVPALAALGPAVLEIEDGAWLVLDADRGELDPTPDEDVLEAARHQLTARQRHEAEERAAAHGHCITADGMRIEVLANLGSLAEARTAVDCGAEGCGLLRSEFLFLDRGEPPDEDEQHGHYQRIAQALDGRPLVVRTLDIGGDKAVPYLSLPAETNPALGLRGVRTSLWRPDLLRVQLRAILRAVPPAQCRLLLPMITDPSDVRAVRAVLEEVRRETAHQGEVTVGAMVETPASALISSRLAEEVDFFSIGTNDLTQYALAMDREHAELALRADGVHPAVLRLIALTVEGARQHQRPVAVCGGLASDPEAVPLLIGLGITELSVLPALVPKIKALVRTLSADACRTLAERALVLDTSTAVRDLVRQHAPATPSRVTP